MEDLYSGARVLHAHSGDTGTIWEDDEGALWLRWDALDEDGDPVDVVPGGYRLRHVGDAPWRAGRIEARARQASMPAYSITVVLRGEDLDASTLLDLAHTWGDELASDFEAHHVRSEASVSET